ncbi:(d)CMP kinase [Bombilactobacillus bombi]|uniref:(d)CMP kinase n=1 Tax=Bombilactobacillus bombi TaxID=1303590 RepID=UPI0015E5EC9D|nr:(d)CMP kinase [Bombilactobacillus bombi]MBA1435079.1 (d)CMP kinase [Bombilactobacillus bombi]
MQIAIDGPASAGKSTIAKIIADKLNYIYTDTGAMYRAVTWLAWQKQVDFGNENQITDLIQKIPINFRILKGQQRIFVGDTDVSEAIRTPFITNNVSQVSSLPLVRQLMVEQQRQIAQNNNVVMDGRDIGTTVLPQADVKIFMVASVHERAKRRYQENLTRGITTSLTELETEIAARDYKDSHRQTSPLKKAADAIEIDTTSLNIDQVVQKILKIIHFKTNK